MISVESAIQLIDTNITKRGEVITVSLEDSLGYILAEDIISPIAIPPFRQSAMDGYALCLTHGNSYEVIDEVKAGDSRQPRMIPGQAARIFTGAPVPDSANAVVMQEKVVVDGDTIFLESEVDENTNIRSLGEQVQKGELSVNKGTLIRPATVGFIATLGLTEIKVYKRPSIAIVVTGNELIQAGNPLEFGQIYESNGSMLLAALRSAGYRDTVVLRVKDEFDATAEKLAEAIDSFDVVLISGGISVGDYDFVGKALYSLGVEEIFYKVKQKPGKPLFFGRKKETFIFALPGNPASSLSCFYVYVYPALQKISGFQEYFPERVQLPSDTVYIKKGDRAQFLKASIKNGRVSILDGQASSMLQSFSVANALVYLGEAQMKVEKNDTVEVIRLP
ncbi:molybdopterin molybdenumtransferase MoeA [Leptobacterium flavescens]|uniref:Molybdopterin molybdenumtransferase n=1 Tax=Leptobacterium flavescens TaxID=472055 RepID=A0A6P0UGW2_9FLAO|nr:gephyrin-like molybdotransferase Glp [Leptobacterium flavescens]NER11872.1 molybdopterin molybdenumtransferase MoeA [Leptobacterium flavescens]